MLVLQNLLKLCFKIYYCVLNFVFFFINDLYEKVTLSNFYIPPFECCIKYFTTRKYKKKLI